jgi:putative membrane-bound dehydrogenase-like protein
MSRWSIALLICVVSGGVDAAELQVGVGKVDVTPTTPIRLSGYAARKTESEGVEQRIFARAMAIGTNKADASVLITLDSMAIPHELTEEVAARLKAKAGLLRERLVLCGTHSHGAPCIANAAINIFGHPVTPDEQGHIDQYTRELADKLEQCALDALGDLKPATLAIARGSVGFAANRRKPIAPGVPGPVDRELPLLVARNPDGSIRAIVANYACHCTTGGPDINRVHGDWAECACSDLEAAYKGAVAMITIGCGADANPSPRGTFALARQHGAAVASEVARLVKTPEALKPLTSAPVGQFKVIDLAYDKLPTKEELEKLAKETTAIGGNARIQLERLARDGKLAETIPYRVQTWTFGDELSMVFLAGEVVVDYALRLKHDFDPARLWVSSYSNDVLCYIPSRRVLAEGGYEAEGAMVYYARPTRFAPAVENDIIRAVHSIVPAGFRSEASLKEFPLPKSPEESRQCFKVEGDLRVELVAAEPLVQSPVAIDWDLRGRLWVLEMYDYPSGLHDNNTPGGRVVILESTKHDGHYDKRTVFLDHLAYPQGLMCWRNGVLVCTAPNILYAPDDDHDDKPDSVKTLFSGFGPDNQQWEVNGLTWGLDNWVYGASSIHNNPIKLGESEQTIDLGGRDFRMNPDTLAFEPAAGRTQFCRVRDDWGNWFGNDNSNSLWHYPLEDRYVRRNPHVAYPPPRVAVVADRDPGKLYPISRLLERFNNPESANRVTSACGPSVYRDELLFGGAPANVEQAFFCEPVHNMVRRLILEPKGATFSAHRSPAGEAEFLASTDNWCRPVQTRTGPDGGLYVVDMYRFVIEHPRWITSQRLATLDTRAGAEMGRIYRVLPTGVEARPIEDFSSLSVEELAGRLDHPNGVVRDLVHRGLVHRQDRTAEPILERIAGQSKSGAVRVQAVCALEGLHALKPELLKSQLADADPRVRRNALRVAEPRLAKDSELAAAALKLTTDPDPAVRYQLALTLGELDDDRATAALSEIAAASPGDVWTRSAVLSSALHHPAKLLEAIAAWPVERAGRAELLGALASLVAAVAEPAEISAAIAAITPSSPDVTATWQLTATAAVLDALDHRSKPISLQQLPGDAAKRVRAGTDVARRLAGRAEVPLAQRVTAIGLLCRDPAAAEDDLHLAADLLAPTNPPALQSAALSAIARGKVAGAADILIAALPRMSPALRAVALDSLTARAESAELLVSAIEQNKLSPTDLPAATREKLLSHPNADLRQHAAGVLASARPPARAKALKDYQASLTLKGDAARGKLTFEKTCAACHQLAGLGNAVGPDLTALTDKSAGYLLTALLDPNAAVEGRFVAYQIETNDGETYVGLLGDENASAITIVQPNAIRQRVPRASIKSLTSSKLSLMPEGLEQGMSPQDVADLIAFVQKPQ